MLLALTGPRRFSACVACYDAQVSFCLGWVLTCVLQLTCPTAAHTGTLALHTTMLHRQSLVTSSDRHVLVLVMSA